MHASEKTGYDRRVFLKYWKMSCCWGALLFPRCFAGEGARSAAAPSTSPSVEDASPPEGGAVPLESREALRLHWASAAPPPV